MFNFCKKKLRSGILKRVLFGLNETSESRRENVKKREKRKLFALKSSEIKKKKVLKNTVIPLFTVFFFARDIFQVICKCSVCVRQNAENKGEGRNN